jgi:adenylate kinase
MVRLGFDLVLLGAPASGKNTQADILKKRFILHPVETGKYIRRLMNGRGSASRRLKKTSQKGFLAPMEIIKDFLKTKVSRVGKGRDLIFVGNPRVETEAKFLNRMMRVNARNYFVIYLALQDSQIKKRSALRHRDLADRLYVQNRINENRTRVFKTLKYFESVAAVKRINGNQTRRAVAASILKALNDHKRSINNPKA